MKIPKKQLSIIWAIFLSLSLTISPAQASSTFKPLLSESNRDMLSYPPDPISDISWSGGTSGVADIQSAFNNARVQENSQLGTSLPPMVLPNQSTWDSMTDNEKSLWLINQERVARGVLPLDNIEDNVTGVAQYYADYLLDNDAWGHSEDGNSPWERLDNNPAIGACHDFLNVAENLAVFVTSGSSIALPIERSIFMWLYDDSGSSWGHRHAILWYPYNDNSGEVGKEGFLGIGRANGGPYQGPFSNPWNFAELIVMNVFDPCPTWAYPGPEVIDITRTDHNPTSASTVDFTVTFSEPVIGVDTADFTLATTGVSGASIVSRAGSGAIYTVTVDTGSGDGTIRLDVNASGTGIEDLAGNPLEGGFTSGEIYTIDKTAPTVSSSTRADDNPTSLSYVNFTVTFDEAVNGVDTADFALTTTGVTGASVLSLTGSVDTYTVLVDTGSGNNGTIRLDVNSSGTGIEDLVGNPLAGGFTNGEIYDVDKDDSFEDPASRWTTAFDYNHGWRVDSHPRMFADVNGDGYDDALGFGLDGIYVALSDGSNFAANATKWTSAFDYNHGWRVDSHPRMFADVDGDGLADALGFGLDGIYVALSDGSSFAANASKWTSAFDYNHGWRVDSHPRMFADVNDDGNADALGFGLDGVYVALSDGSSFAANATKWTSAFDYNHGWRVDSHPRIFADVNGDDNADALGFGLDGIYVALSDGSSFAANATKWTSAFDYNHGWRVDSHPRIFADVNGDGYADALGFGLDGAYVALSDGSSFAAAASRWTTAFDYNHGWRVDSHPRLFADVNGDGNADALGFGLDGIYVALSQ